MKTKFLVIGLLLGVSSAMKLHSLQHQRDDGDALSAIDAAIDAAEKDGEPKPAPVIEEKAPEPPKDAAAELPEEPQPKKDEVEDIMDKYDHEEEHAAFIKSDAYRAQIKAKKDKEIDKQSAELKDLELTLGNLEDSKKLAGRTTGLSDREAHAAEDDEYLQGLLTQYAVDGKKGLKMLTKDKAYLAAGKCVEKWRGLKGEDNQNYLKANFDETWNNYDVKGKNKIEESEAYQLHKEI